MIIIHSMDSSILPRLVGSSLRDRLHAMPAVVVTGARQTGKSTLVRELIPGTRRYLSLDDLDVLDLARTDPETLVGGRQPVTLDEVQREPELLRAVKRAIDRRRTPARFLLTGSANLLLMRRVSETLAGRASYLTLWPMTRREQRGSGRCGAWDDLPRRGRRRLARCARFGADRDRGLAGRGGAEEDSRLLLSTWTQVGSERFGSTATSERISSAICRCCPRSPPCPTSDA